MPTKEKFYEYVRNATHGKKCYVIYFLGWIDFLTHDAPMRVLRARELRKK